MNKEKHPSWFKLKDERRALLEKIPPETAVKVLLACFDYLETEELPKDMTPNEEIAFFAFFPDVVEAWTNYEKRVNARKAAHEGKAE